MGSRRTEVREPGDWALASRGTRPGGQEDWAKESMQVLGHGKQED